MIEYLKKWRSQIFLLWGAKLNRIMIRKIEKKIQLQVELIYSPEKWHKHKSAQMQSN